MGQRVGTIDLLWREQFRDWGAALLDYPDDLPDLAGAVRECVLETDRGTALGRVAPG